MSGSTVKRDAKATREVGDVDVVPASAGVGDDGARADVGETVSAHVGKGHAVVVEQRQAHAAQAADVIVDGSPEGGCLGAGEVKALQNAGIHTRGRNIAT